MSETDLILQDSLPCLPWMDPRQSRLPGILPLEDDRWTLRDEAYGGQMALRDRLISGQRERVHALLPGGRAAADELYSLLLERLRADPGYRFEGDSVLRPDGVRVTLERDEPLVTLGRLVQEDLCLLDTSDEGHWLAGALLCFPAGWTLAQKIGKPLLAIHVPVPEYDDRVARGVQRMFDAIRPGQPLWRMNYLAYDNARLHQPRLEGEARPAPQNIDFVRCERQVMIRLPETRAVLFSIHTYIVRSSSLPAEAFAALRARELTIHG